MKYVVSIAVVFCLAVLLAAPTVYSDVPQVINYQGWLVNDVTGEPITNISPGVQMVFTIWNDPTATDPPNRKWSSGPQMVPVEEGVFTYLLGSHAALPGTIFASDTSNWLGITVETDPEIAPRTQLVTVPYAYHALRADTATYTVSTSGWTDRGDEVVLTDSLDMVGIGTWTPQTHLHVKSDVVQPTIWLESANPSEIMFGEGVNICSQMYEPGSGIWSLMSSGTQLTVGPEDFVGINRVSRSYDGEILSVNAPYPPHLLGGINVNAEFDGGGAYYSYSIADARRAYHGYNAYQEYWFLVVDDEMKMTVTPSRIHAPGFGGSLTWNSDSGFVGINMDQPLGINNHFGIRIPAEHGSGGMVIEAENEWGWPYYGYATDSIYRALHYYEGTSNRWVLTVGSSRLSMDDDYTVAMHNSSADSTIIFDADTIGDAAVVLPDSAINADERLNEPGIAYDRSTPHLIELRESEMTPLAWVGIEIPTDGWVHVMGRCTFQIYEDSGEGVAQATFQIDTSSGGFDNVDGLASVATIYNGPAFNMWSVYVDKVYELAKGIHWFCLEGNNTGDLSDEAHVVDPSVVAVFYPTNYEFYVP